MASSVQVDLQGNRYVTDTIVSSETPVYEELYVLLSAFLITDHNYLIRKL